VSALPLPVSEGWVNELLAHSPTVTRYVVCAANRRPDGLVVCGPRHCDPTMNRMIHISGGQTAWHGAEQGFVDQWGIFLTRQQAWMIALMADQIRRRVGGDDRDGGTLYSENLY
jgi:hypothetical protein